VPILNRHLRWVQETRKILKYNEKSLSDLSQGFEVDDILRVSIVSQVEHHLYFPESFLCTLCMNVPYHNILTRCQSGIVPLNHPIKINILWFKPIYDIEHLNFQSALDFDLI